MITAGIYLIKDSITEQKYLASLNGKEPFIRITNIISLSSFAQGEFVKANTIISEIVNNPARFEFKPISGEILTEPQSTVEAPVTYTDDLYESIMNDQKNFDETYSLRALEVIPDIMAKTYYDWEKATKVFDLINTNYMENDRWSKINQCTESVEN